MREVIEEVLRNRILFIGEEPPSIKRDCLQIYSGCPNDLIDEILRALGAHAHAPAPPATEERKEFEASVEFVGYEFNKISTGDYANRDTYHAFLGWAARSRRKTE